MKAGYRIFEKHFLPTIKRAVKTARPKAREICGLIVFDGYRIEVVQTKNAAKGPGRFELPPCRVRKIENGYLDDGPDRLEADLKDTRRRVYSLADEIDCGETALGPAASREAVAARILASELSLRASQAAMLHTGTTGFRVGAVAERKLRESYFVATVTPSLKHLERLQ